ncbi:N-acetyl-beta-glucosaminyl-glycoprotein 4-beta-N-acetylgalactosaminyltransferase 1 [Colossoma macropomum]|uniref:N-acetyl-beta-glucosaminyl-glycoprotein 4-beta-N-acetylgalactosaminyltransferase 1 n=1 Tax=Colossoma macropomum TaxID=42526 RepID=UPI00186564B6|nr:N-acetyl-beta-glucosaminyl-glycoprotein 4-beta-N-acetylgalactosaminyltransferase 1 [Colossoma macropomum]
MRFPLKKIRKQFKLLLLLVLLTFAIGFTYLHINQGKAIKLHFNYGKDMEKQTEGLGSGHKKLSHSSPSHPDREESSDSGEETQGGDELGEAGQESRGQTEIRKLLSQKFLKLPWKPEYKGQANLHVFEDWCGSSVSQLRKNLHFPLYPHARTTVKKLAVAPKWKNYGLRIFGFIHPYKDGDFQFAIASDDNSELWLSSDENPLNARLLVYVGRHGSEWTAPGEFTKFRSQTSKSIHLMSSRRYYFEILHKQDDKGSDHVEVGWRPFLPGLKYDVIDSAYISLYTDESSLKMNSVKHIPQTLASHTLSLQEVHSTETHTADMLKTDPRDTFYKIPMIDRSRLDRVLPSCLYSPTYIVKDFPIARYQGLQFVYLSYVYPNDFTRLTHMERENKCFYRESPVYLEKFGFYKYMKMDEEEDDRPAFFPNPDDFLEEEEGVDPEEESVNPNNHQARRTSNISPSNQLSISSLSTVSASANRISRDSKGYILAREGRYSQLKGKQARRRVKGEGMEREDGYYSTQAKAQEEEERGMEKERQLRRAEIIGTQHEHLNEHRESEEVGDDPQIHAGQRSLMWVPLSPVQQSNKVIPLKLSKTSKNFQQSPLYALASQILSNAAHPAPIVLKSNQEKEIKTNKIYITRPRPPKSRPREVPRPPVEVFPGVFLYQTARGKKLVDLSSRWKSMKKHGGLPLFWSSLSMTDHKSTTQQVPLKQNHQVVPTDQEHQDLEVSPSPSFKISRSASVDSNDLPPSSPDKTDDPEIQPTKASEMAEESQQRRAAEPEEGGVSQYSYEDTEPRPGWAEEAINWQRTFTVNPVDFELLRSDWNDLRCNVSGNLQLAENEVVDVLSQYIERLNERNGGIYTLLRVVNVEKRRDSARGSRYLVELELMEAGKRVVRLSEYIYLLLHRSRQDEGLSSREVSTPSAPTAPSKPPAPTSSSSAQSRASTPWGSHWPKPLLCQPAMLQWRHDVMVHFVVPVKNQARWVQQFISDMELLHRETKDDNFSIIIVDFESEDMDVEQALRDSTVPRYEYLRREGNFERSSGLQMGVDTIEDSHSIVFLCDLHIHFPMSILESIRKHCVEGRLAFAPIVMRLDCGSSPLQPNGYWEVNGFGLFGIYKSDFDKIGGMNTEEFKDRWGGEDWEFLDRVLQNGLEVERLRLRNFYHYYHSKRGMWNSPIKKPTQG